MEKEWSVASSTLVNRVSADFVTTFDCSAFDPPPLVHIKKKHLKLMALKKCIMKNAHMEIQTCASHPIFVLSPAAQ